MPSSLELPLGNKVQPKIRDQDFRSRRGGSGVEKGGDACVAHGGVATQLSVFGGTLDERYVSLVMIKS